MPVRLAEALEHVNLIAQNDTAARALRKAD
jgi:hypothetical protein